MNRCYNCKFWATRDIGYSCVTVLETEVHCLKKQFEPITESYSWRQPNQKQEEDHQFFKQAEKCSHFIESPAGQISIDAENEITIEDFKEDKELYEAAVNYGW